MLYRKIFSLSSADKILAFVKIFIQTETKQTILFHFRLKILMYSIDFVILLKKHQNLLVFLFKVILYTNYDQCHVVFFSLHIFTSFLNQ